MSETLKTQHEQQIDTFKQEYLDAITQQWLATKKELSDLQVNIVWDNEFLADAIQDSGIVEETMWAIPKYLLDTYLSGWFFSWMLAPTLSFFFEKEQVENIKQCRKDLIVLKKTIWKDSFTQQMQHINSEYLGWASGDLYGADLDLEVTDFDLDSDILSLQEYDDKEPRERVISAIDDIKQINQDTPIWYKMGSRKIEWSNPRIDCSGLVSTVLDKAWFAVWDQTSRSLFAKFDTKQLSAKVDNSVKVQKSVLDNTKPGDIVYWNSTNSEYTWSTGAIPSIKKDGKDYRIHHVAVITDTFADGRLRIFEANGKDGVTERVINPKDVLADRSKSELYVSNMRYDALPAKRKIVA